jgi:hypothetical protein
MNISNLLGGLLGGGSGAGKTQSSATAVSDNSGAGSTFNAASAYTPLYVLAGLAVLGLFVWLILRTGK